MRAAPHPRLEIVPMIDIMMFLLIFFVLIALRMIPDSGVAVELPSANTAAPMRPTPTIIGIDRHGALHMHDEELTPDMLGERLGALSRMETAAVVIAADKAVSFQQIMAVMDALRKAGISDVGLAAALEQ